MTNKKVNQFTHGEWNVVNVGENLLIETHPCCYVTCDIKKANDKDKANAQLIATAGTTATKLSEMGYDAVKLIEKLPSLIKAIEPEDYTTLQWLVELELDQSA